MHESEFYVGYQRRAPRGLARFLTLVASGLVVAAAVVAGVLTATSDREVAKTFEFGAVRDWSGTLLSRPVPMLLTDNGAGYVLVSPGKHGFDPGALDGRASHLKGTLIAFGRNRMLEVMAPPESSATAARATSSQPVGPVVLEGEVVDTKCYFGVMQPGSGKVHRDCATRCISGGVPPGLLVRDERGQLEVVLLAAADNRDGLRHKILPFAGERVRLAGTLSRTPVGLVMQIELKEKQQPWNNHEQ